jgi:type IV pilus assembly protein PilY1
MKFRTYLFALLALVAALVHLPAAAEDIDLFTGSTSSGTLPNLLIVIDNAADFDASAANCTLADGTTTAINGTLAGIEQCALFNVLYNLDLSGGAPVNIGVMMYGASQPSAGYTCTGTGGCIVYPVKPLTSANRTTMLAWIKTWSLSGNKSMKANGEATGASMQEAWSYYYGKTGLSGHNYALDTDRPDIHCKNFVLFIGNNFSSNGKPGDQGGGIGAALTSAGGDVSILTEKSGITPAATMCGNESGIPTNSSHDTGGFYADEWTRYMTTQRITTYTIGILDTSKCKPDYAWLLSSMATNGGGDYFPTTNYTQLVNALQTILSEVRSVNSVFAAVSLPVSVNSQGTYLNQVFIGMFRPDPNANPRWNGNLKQYKMGFAASSGAFTLLDADSNLAISASGSQFIAECARSYWTPAATAAGDGYWTMLTTQNCIGFPASSNSPDGNLVEKGGEGYQLRSIAPADRTVTTCSGTVSSCQTTLTTFNSSNGALTTSTLNISGGTPSTTDMINWTRGSDNKTVDDYEPGYINGHNLGASDMRPSVHGDVVHSRPAAINFGTDASPKVVVFYGGNDGMLRAVNGNRTLAFNVGTTSVPAGAEFWTFVPPEFDQKLIRRYNNAPIISSTNPKDYAMDGPITAYRASNGDAWLFMGMRRGGRVLYAFKVDHTTLGITLMWKNGCADEANGNCNPSASGDFTGLGQTWAPPQVFTAQNTGASTPLLIVGGGYDACREDTANYNANSCSNAERGKGFYVMNAQTGALLNTFATARGVIADVTIVPDSNGNAAFIYGADTAGNLYRISGPLSGGSYQPIGNTAVGSWVITTVAQVGCDSTPTCTPNRKFMFAPDVVIDGSTYILLLGSGDREKPTNTSNPVHNYFFAIQDRPDLGNSYLNDGANCGGSYSGLCLSSFLQITQGTTPTSTALASKKGWYLSLNTNEQVVTGAIAVFGTVYFTTHEPQPTPASACVPNLGTSRAYAVKYTNAAAARASGSDYIARSDAGLAPDLVAGKVTLDNGSTVPFCIGCDGPITPSQPIPPGTVSNPAKIRSYWYITK